MALLCCHGACNLCGRPAAGKRETKPKAARLSSPFLHFLDALPPLNKPGVLQETRRSLPLGISFYTFQMTGYLIDVYRRDISPDRSFPLLSTNFLLFPKLISGPITPYGGAGLAAGMPDVQRPAF